MWGSPIIGGGEIAGHNSPAKKEGKKNQQRAILSIIVRTSLEKNREVLPKTGGKNEKLLPVKPHKKKGGG